MSINFLKSIFIFALAITLTSATSVSTNKIMPDLKPFTPEQWQAETSQDKTDLEPVNFEDQNQDMSEFYETFNDQEEIKIYIGWGKDAWDQGRFSHFINVLINTINYQRLNIIDFKLNNNTLQAQFKSRINNKTYFIQGGFERDAYIAALKNYDIVIYHGHSRYGRGPAFEKYQNYFRLGTNHDFIAVSYTHLTLPTIYSV